MKLGFLGSLAFAAMALAACGDEGAQRPRYPGEASAPNPASRQAPARTRERFEKLSPQAAFAQIGHGDKKKTKHLSRGTSFTAQVVTWSEGPKVSRASTGSNSVDVEIVKASGGAPTRLQVLEVTPSSAQTQSLPKPYQPAWTLDGKVVKISRMGFTSVGKWQLAIRASIDGKEDVVEIPIEVLP